MCIGGSFEHEMDTAALARMRRWMAVRSEMAHHKLLMLCVNLTCSFGGQFLAREWHLGCRSALLVKI